MTAVLEHEISLVEEASSEDFSVPGRAELNQRFLLGLLDLREQKKQEVLNRHKTLKRPQRPRKKIKVVRRSKDTEEDWQDPTDPLTARHGVNHPYSPRGAALKLLKSKTPQVVLSGPAGTGKSRACLEKLNLLNLYNPGARTLVVRKTLASLGSTGLVTWREKVAKEGLEHGVLTFFGGSAQEPAQYKYANGSVMVVGGMDKATKIMSSEYDAIYVQEATELDENDWEMLDTRLRNGRISFQQLMADCNPDKPTHWLKHRSDSGKTLMMFSEHRDNPVLFDEHGQPTEFGRTYLDKLNNLSGVRKLRLCDGIWAAAEGLVYEDFDPNVHLVDRFDIPREWNRYWTVDFGYTNPFVCQFWAEDPDGRLFMYREIYMTRRTVDKHAEKIAHLVMDNAEKLGGTWSGMWKEPQPVDIICDHDAEGRAVFERELGMSTKNAHKAVTEGIQAVQGRLAAAGDGKPRIYFLRDSLVEKDPELDDLKKPTCTIDEITGYIWDDKGKEVPVKKDDHGMDATRYMVADVDLVGRPRVTSFSY